MNAAEEARDGSGWFVDRVEVAELGARERRAGPAELVFPCMRWIGRSESGSRSGPGIQVRATRAVRAACGRRGRRGRGAARVTRCLAQVLFPMAPEHQTHWRWGAGQEPVWNARRRATQSDAVLTAAAAALPHPKKVRVRGAAPLRGAQAAGAESGRTQEGKEMRSFHDECHSEQVEKGVKALVKPGFGYAGEDAYVSVSEGPIQARAAPRSARGQRGQPRGRRAGRSRAGGPRR